jgi:hypothetical protein
VGSCTLGAEQGSAHEQEEMCPAVHRDNICYYGVTLPDGVNLYGG